jgi:hypothetical protein
MGTDRHRDRGAGRKIDSGADRRRDAETDTHRQVALTSGARPTSERQQVALASGAHPMLGSGSVAAGRRVRDASERRPPQRDSVSPSDQPNDRRGRWGSAD